MPQMMPMYWIYMLIILMILMIMLSSFTYFYTPYMYQPKINNDITYHFFNSPWNWKW